MRVGVDTGGTFTDVVTEAGDVVKVPSQPADPAAAVAAGLGSLPVSLLAHGTTVATNALLERRGAEVALVTNAGMEDVIEIARQDRPSLYDQWADRPPPLVERGRRYGVPGRLAADGSELEAVVPEGLPAIEAEAVAVCLLHSDLDDRHEVAVAAHLRALGHDVTCSHEVSPELREYERTVTTVVNAYLRPACRSYLQGLAGLAPAVSVMTSAGGLVDLAFAADRPAALLLSGPAAGVRAAAAIAVANGFHGAVGFDMGGTSTDVCLIEGGVPDPSPSLVVGGYPVRLPALGDPHRGGRRRLGGVDRPRGRPAGRPAVGRSGARPGVLRARGP